MKTIGIISLFIFLSFGFSSNETKVKITNKSEVTIKGKSNVNSFECKYDSDFIENDLNVQIVKSNSKIILGGARLAIKSKGFDCAHRMITKDFKSILKADDYPHIIIYVKEINTLKDNITAKLNVSIAGKDKDYIVPITYNQNTNNVKGQLRLDIKDFKLKSPKKLLGMVVVNDNVDINFNLFLQY
ncbi:YceI family protein [Flavobacterium sp. HXWNR69]|uniref:YceI family protein n=1 Tax=Flavobacterium fragile TaxID=2949085 RepID=A0ABT0TD52_9FLAO|nr:YceI family protein [Flavobacterium sp. HXWNR69]MCL9768819.1 YceI family protein [Flavobacterium sp. HXWNR69]